MTAVEADEVRRAFARPNNEHLIAMHWERFREGAARNGVSEKVMRKIFAKINGHYMFPSPTRTPSPSPRTRRRG